MTWKYEAEQIRKLGKGWNKVFLSPYACLEAYFCSEYQGFHTSVVKFMAHTWCPCDRNRPSRLFTQKHFIQRSLSRAKYNSWSLDICHPNSPHVWLSVSWLRHNVLAIKRKRMDPTEFNLFVWFIACTVNHNYISLVAMIH